MTAPDQPARVDPARLGAHVAALTAHGPRHASNPSAVTAALAYLSDQLATVGFAAETHRYADGDHHVNLVATLPGAGDGPALEVGAHWDSVVGSPGADDNASGVAGVLEIARLLRECRPRRTVRFCLFGDEENSEAYPIGRGGSGGHVAALDAAVPAQPGGAPAVEGVIVLEMIGYRDPRRGSQRLPEGAVAGRDAAVAALVDRGVFAAVVGNHGGGDYVDAVVRAARRLDPPLPVVPVLVAEDDTANATRSDHWRYWVSGRKGVMVTDTAEFRNPHYHRPTDTLDTLDLDFAAQITQAVADAVVDLAG